MNSATILIVDDDAFFTRDVTRILSSAGYQTYVAHSVREAERSVVRNYPDVVMMDLSLPDGNGSDLVGRLKGEHPAMQFIIVTGHASIRSAVESTKQGATEYLTKPVDREVLLVAVRNALKQSSLSEEVELLRRQAIDNTGTEEETPYPSSAIQRTIELARNAAQGDSIVLLLGESGTGKDHWARWIHRHSLRSSGPFFSLNCAALSRELAESELFGYEPGAFTGAQGRKRGLLELARNGTLLLNEIGELDLSLQAKLLTFFDTRSFLRVGGENPVTVNARIVAATNRDLGAEVVQGAFRQDLYYRLNVFAIDLPPLRERTADIPVLARDILKQLKHELGLSELPQIDKSALDSLMGFSWPGNIRELRNVLERGLIASRGGTIQGGHLKLLSEEREWAFNVTFSNDLNLHEVTKDLARQLINEALRRAGTKTGAARLLGISRDSFNYQVKSLKLDEPK